jgi:hypothetical protein
MSIHRFSRLLPAPLGIIRASEPLLALCASFPGPIRVKDCMNILALATLLAVGLSASVSIKAEVASNEHAEFVHAAAGLIPAHTATKNSTDLTKLFRLQLAAERFPDAEATLDRLEAAYRSDEPRRIPILTPWRIYTRAKAYELAGATSQSALNHAFSELYGSLTDAQAAVILPWYSANVDSFRAEEAKQEKACEGLILDRCPTAADLIAAREVSVALTYLMPASAPLLEADTRRRYQIDDVLIPTPDGAKIDAMVVRPRATSAVKLTALLNFTIYAKADWRLSDAVMMAAHGYAGVVAYTRGKGQSPGSTIPYVLACSAEAITASPNGPPPSIIRQP